MFQYQQQHSCEGRHLMSQFVCVCVCVPTGCELADWTFAPQEPVQGSWVRMVQDMCLIRASAVWESEQVYSRWILWRQA